MAKEKETKTNVMRVLDRAKIPYRTYTYEHGDGPVDGESVAALLGLYGVIAATALIIWYAAGLESFGKAYTAPFTGSDTAALVRVFLKRPNRANKFRSAHLAGENRRRQK